MYEHKHHLICDYWSLFNLSLNPIKSRMFYLLSILYSFITDYYVYSYVSSSLVSSSEPPVSNLIMTSESKLVRLIHILKFYCLLIMIEYTGINRHINANNKCHKSLLCRTYNDYFTSFNKNRIPYTLKKIPFFKSTITEFLHSRSLVRYSNHILLSGTTFTIEVNFSDIICLKKVTTHNTPSSHQACLFVNHLLSGSSELGNKRPKTATLFFENVHLANCRVFKCLSMPPLTSELGNKRPKTATLFFENVHLANCRVFKCLSMPPLTYNSFINLYLIPPWHKFLYLRIYLPKTETLFCKSVLLNINLSLNNLSMSTLYIDICEYPIQLRNAMHLYLCQTFMDIMKLLLPIVLNLSIYLPG
jgi:hypothetical protein